MNLVVRHKAGAELQSLRTLRQNVPFDLRELVDVPPRIRAAIVDYLREADPDERREILTALAMRDWMLERC